MNEPIRPSVARIDLDALRHNVRTLSAHVHPAAVCAVVKADAYGHGAVECAQAALDAGARYLSVALVEEALELRSAGIAAPIVLISEPPPESEAILVEYDIVPTVYTSQCIDALEATASRSAAVLRVHLKVDTGMRRVGAEIEDAQALARRIEDAPHLELEATWTHFAVADELDDPFTLEQAKRFDDAVESIRRDGIEPGFLHAANSAGSLRDPRRYGYDMVRIGIALYGLPPCRELAGTVDLMPVMTLESELSYVRPIPAGTRVSYGLRYAMPTDGYLGTVPLGYADGVRRNLTGAAEVLVGGRRYPVAGTITMDQFMVDLGSDAYETGETVTLIGSQRGTTISALDWADALGTIAYEITCGVGTRVPRLYTGSREQDRVEETPA